MSGEDLRTGFKKLMYGKTAMRDTLVTGIAELVGTAILVFLGCMGCIGSLGVVPSHLQITVTFGLAVMIVIQCFAHISHAHVNPAITVGAVVLGKKSVIEASVYFVSQMIGAILGYGLLKMMTPGDLLTQTGPSEIASFCVTDVNSQLTWLQGLMAEGFATGILMLIACATWDERNANNMDSAALKFGLAVTGIATVIGPYTGCSMNPARSFAPAIWNGRWSHHWIYWVGPVGGAAIAAFFYRTVFGSKSYDDRDGNETIAETIALNSIDTEKPERV